MLQDASADTFAVWSRRTVADPGVATGRGPAPIVSIDGRPPPPAVVIVIGRSSTRHETVAQPT